jgi:hypothetical protein
MDIINDPDEHHEIKNVDLNLYCEGNYLLWVFNKIKWLNINSPIRLNILLFLLGWGIPFILATYSRVHVPTEEVKNACFLYDLTMYAFFVISLPLIINMEYHISTTLNEVLKKLIKMLTIPIDKLHLSVDRTNRWAKSSVLHLIALTFAYITSIAWILTLLKDSKETWHGTEQSTLSFISQTPTLAGAYVAFISMPIGLYIIYVWALKAGLWVLLIKNITSYPVRANPLHVDGCGGLLFFNRAILAWGFLFMAIGFLIALDCAKYVYILGDPFSRWDLILKPLVFIILAPSFFVGQLFFFTPHLIKAKHRYLDDIIKAGHIHAKTVHTRVKEVINRNNSLLELDSNKGGVDALDSVYRKAKSMRILPFDIGTLAKFLTNAGAPLSLLIPMLPGIKKLIYLLKQFTW